MNLQNIHIDAEFRSLIPPLTPKEYAGLEQNILTYGCRVPLDLWGNILLDGHNRYMICQQHHISFETKQINFENRIDAMLWILHNQLDRRNLPLYERGRLELLQAHILEAQAKQKKIESGKSYGKNHSKQQVFVNSQKPQNEPIHVVNEISKTSGIGQQTLSRIKKLEEKAPEGIKSKLRTGEISINEAYKQIKRDEQKEKRHQIALALEEPTHMIQRLEDLSCRYRVVYADPPWRYGNDHSKALVGLTRPDDHYNTLSTQDICNLPIKQIAIQDSVLFLWSTNAHLQEAFQVIEAWGFLYKTNLVWDKGSHNYGPYTNVQHELLLLCTRGICPPEKSGSIPSVIRIQKTTHSTKPQKFREIIETLYPWGQKIELFARKKTDNWDCWGNEV